MSGQEQINQSTNQEIQNLETIIQQLESEIINVETTIECQTLKRVTINFLQILKTRANAKIQALRQNQNTGTSNQ
jgi:exonuclease VII small subunit